MTHNVCQPVFGIVKWNKMDLYSLLYCTFHDTSLVVSRNYIPYDIALSMIPHWLYQAIILLVILHFLWYPIGCIKDLCPLWYCTFHDTSWLYQGPVPIVVLHFPWYLIGCIKELYYLWYCTFHITSLVAWWYIEYIICSFWFHQLKYILSSNHIFYLKRNNIQIIHTEYDTDLYIQPRLYPGNSNIYEWEEIPTKSVRFKVQSPWNKVYSPHSITKMLVK